MMDPALENLGWTETQWNRICTTVTEEAQKGRVAAQLLPAVGPEDASTVAVPNFTLEIQRNPTIAPWATAERLAVDSDPSLPLTSISVNVPLHTHEVADPNLTAALGMFRRAANYIARVEDALVFAGRPGTNLPPPFGLGQIPDVVRVAGNGPVDGLLLAYNGGGGLRSRSFVADPNDGNVVIEAIIRAISQLDANGQLGPFACALSPVLFQAICRPSPALVLPRDRILPFLQGPLVRASALYDGWGVVLALSGSPIELVVAHDIGVRYIQTTEEPRYVFRVSERVALRIKEPESIALLYS
jgi:uncharacterized linocin/CFP29 family protein